MHKTCRGICFSLDGTNLPCYKWVNIYTSTFSDEHIYRVNPYSKNLLVKDTKSEKNVLVQSPIMINKVTNLLCCAVPRFDKSGKREIYDSVESIEDAMKNKYFSKIYYNQKTPSTLVVEFNISTTKGK